MKTLNTTEKKSIETPEKWQIWRKRINIEKTPEKTPEHREQERKSLPVGDRGLRSLFVFK